MQTTVRERTLVVQNNKREKTCNIKGANNNRFKNVSQNTKNKVKVKNKNCRIEYYMKRPQIMEQEKRKEMYRSTQLLNRENIKKSDISGRHGTSI